MSTLQAHRIETTLSEDGTLTLNHLPFHAGEAVEVIVLPHAGANQPQDRYSLRGMPVHYIDPHSSVAAEDWDAPFSKS